MTYYLLLLWFLASVGAQDPDWESIYLSLPSAANARAHLQYITSQPHVAGTDGDYTMANYVHQQFLSYGLKSQIVPVQVLLNYPISSSLAIIDPPESRFVANLSEDIVPQDPTSDTWYRNHTFNGYGPGGNVTGPLVYVNYGTIDDFEYLVTTLKMNLTGAIAIARYGSIFRGLKARFAQQYGCAGILVYSDPADDGYGMGAVYPDGPWRPTSGVQRGSVQFNSLCAGDPGFVERDPTICGYQTDELIPQIPVIPISYGDAQPLLTAIGGPVAPSAWQAGLPITYHIGPGPAIANFVVVTNMTIAPIWNVIATIDGLDNSKATVLGNHRDAWVFGAADPNSGTATMLEVARSFGVMLQQGWVPGRSIILASWDGEEYGLLGSTGWVEKNQDQLSKSAMAYLNVDIAVTGVYFQPGATPSLHGFLTNATRNLTVPTTNKTLYDTWASQNNGTTPIGILGSGSDFTSFLDYLGIASMDLGFKINPTHSYGVYHSDYDSFYWMETFGDPTFQYHQLMAQYWGLLAIRLSDYRVLPFNYSNYAQALLTYANQVEAQAASAGVKVDFSNLDYAIHNFIDITTLVENTRQAIIDDPNTPQQKVDNLNVHLYYAERKFLNPQGLPERQYFKHVVQAPGINEGYDANVFPGLIQAIQANNQTLAQQQANTISYFINNVGAYLSELV